MIHWIPEFRNNGEKTITYQEEERFSFENLTLVAKNYAEHGFKNVIILDLNNDYIERLPKIFSDYDFAIFTLRLNDDKLLKSRASEDTRSSGYRNWNSSLEINQRLLDRAAYTDETLIEVGSLNVNEIVAEIIKK